MNKRYLIKIYDLAGTIKKSFGSDAKDEGAKVISSFSFNSKMNGGQGELQIELRLPIDDFGEGDTVKDMNIVRLYEFDQNNPAGVLIYTGFISQYTPYAQGSTEGVKITCLGLVSLLSLARYMSGSSYTVASSGDPGTIAKAIIDHFNTVYPGSLIGYAGGNVSLVGTSVGYTFENKSWLDALSAALGLAGAGWWWHIDAAGDLSFKAKPGAAVHKLTIGKDIDNIEVPKSNEKVINQIQIIPGSPSTPGVYTDAASIALYGLRDPGPETDSDINDNTTRDQKGNKKIADNKDRKVKPKIRVNANYNIEKLKPGDTVSVFNAKGVNLFPANLQIASVDYTPDMATLEIEDTVTNLANQLKETIKQIA